MLTTIFLLFCITAILYWLLKPNQNKNLPPGPPKWPIIGNILELAFADSTYPHNAFVKLAAKYGDVMSLKMGVHDACVITSYEAYKDICTREEAQGRYPFPFVLDRAFNKTLGIIWGAEMWHDLRKFTVKCLREFGFGKVKSVDVLLQEEVADMVEYAKNKASKNNGIVEMNAHDYAGSMVNILWSMVAGYKFPIGDPTVHAIIEHGNNISLVTSQNNIYNAFPKLRYWFPKLTNWDKHMNSHKEYQQFVMGMIEKARMDRASRQDQEAQNFIEVFLDEIAKSKGNPNSVFTEEQLIVVLQDLFLAGSETTGTAIIWCLLYISLHPRVQNKLREEVLKVFPNTNQPLSVADLKKLSYFRAFIYEVFRASQFVTVPPPRMAVKDFSYKGYTIPKGTLIMNTFQEVFADKNHWGDPEVFRPERFLDSNGSLTNTERVCIFGSGKRVCMGESLVWDAMPMYLANMLRHFEFIPIPGKEPTPLNPISTGTLNPQKFSLIMKEI